MRWHTGRGAEDGHSTLLEQLARVVARLWAAYLGIVEEASAARSDTRLVDAVHRVGTRSLSSWRDRERPQGLLLPLELHAKHVKCYCFNLNNY